MRDTFVDNHNLVLTGKINNFFSIPNNNNYEVQEIKIPIKKYTSDLKFLYSNLTKSNPI